MIRNSVSTFSEPIGVPTSRELLKLHDIASEGSCFIRKYILDLTQLLIQVTRLHIGGHVLVIVIDLHVPLDEEGLDELHHLQSHHQGDWHHVATQ